VYEEAPSFRTAPCIVKFNRPTWVIAQIHTDEAQLVLGLLLRDVISVGPNYNGVLPTLA
jgi:hypothetical protein